MLLDIANWYLLHIIWTHYHNHKSYCTPLC